MIDMAINKIDFAGNTLIDLTSDTVTADTLSEGVVAHGADGEVVTGTLKVTGVYIGSGDMPDDCVLQIDPDGSATDLVDMVIAALENGDEVAY